MPLLDIEDAIKAKAIDSRFRLVSIASQRAREINSPTETTLAPVVTKYRKVTTNALSEIIKNKIKFVKEAEKQDA